MDSNLVSFFLVFSFVLDLLVVNCININSMTTLTLIVHTAVRCVHFSFLVIGLRYMNNILNGREQSVVETPY